MSNYSLEGAGSQIVDNPGNLSFISTLISGTTVTYFPRDISTNYSEIENKAFLHLFMRYQRLSDVNSGTVRGLQISTSHSYDQTTFYQIFYKKTDTEVVDDWNSANLFLPIVKHTDGKSYVNLKISTLEGAKYIVYFYIRGGIG